MYNIFLRNLVVFCTSILFLFAQEADVTLTLDGNNLNYVSTSEIAGLQVNHDGCTINAFAFGATAAAGFTVSASLEVVLGFSFSGAAIPAGSGTLLDLGSDEGFECSTIDGLVFTGPAGATLVAELSDGGGDPILPTVSILSPADGSSFDDVASVDVEVSC